VILHGFAGSGCMLFPIIRPLMEHFRVILVDQLGFGGSTRVKEMPITAFASVEAMDEYTVGWLTNWVEQMDIDDELPSKFFFHGHSHGGYMASLYASKHPERIAGLFLNSPIGPESIPEEYDVYNLRIRGRQEGPTYYKEVDFWLAKWQDLDTPLSVLRQFPLWI
jgi:pimeloyl-ACP methyl ester carboxylesterase